MELPNNKLKLPEGVTAQGPVMDLAEAYMKAVVALPEILEDMVDAMNMVALYCERKGMQEGIISADDLDKGEGNEIGTN